MSKVFVVECRTCEAMVLQDVSQIRAEHISVLQRHLRICSPTITFEHLGDLLKHFDVRASSSDSSV